MRMRFLVQCSSSSVEMLTVNQCITLLMMYKVKTSSSCLIVL